MYEKLIGMGVPVTKALTYTGLVYVLLPVSHMIFTLAASFCNARWGIKYGFIIGQVFFLLFLLVFSGAKSILEIMWGFVLWGMASAFWWVSYHSYFIELSEKKKLGNQISKVEIIGILAGLIGPIFAGVMMTIFGKFILFPIVCLVSVVGLIFFIWIEEKKKLSVVGLQDLVSVAIKYPRDFISYMGAGAEEIVYSVAWSLFLYFVFKNYSIIGLFTSLVVLISIALAYLVGKWTDTLSKDKIEKLGAGIISASWLTRALLQHPVFMFLLDSVYKVFFSCFLIPFRAIAYKHALEDNINRYVVFREIGYAIGNIVALLCFVLIAYMGFPLWYTFILGALFALIPMIISEKKYV